MSKELPNPKVRDRTPPLKKTLTSPMSAGRRMNGNDPFTKFCLKMDGR